MAVAERTEEQILAQEPITLRFGTQDYKAKILGFASAKEWRAHTVEVVRSIVDVHKQECETNDAFTHGLAFFFLSFPDKMLDVVFSYAVDLPRDVVMQEATDEQIALAFEQVVAIGFPFTRQLGMISHVMSIASTSPRLAKSLN